MSRVNRDDHNFNDESSSPVDSPRFPKQSASAGKKPDSSHLNLKLDKLDKEADSLDDSDEDSRKTTGRSTSSITSTPKPKGRSFMKKSETPKRIDIDDDDRNVFGKMTMKPSPRRPITTLKEDEDEDQRFVKSFTRESRSHSPDVFDSRKKQDSHRSSRRSPTALSSSEESDQDSYDSKTNRFKRKTDGRKNKVERDSVRSRESSDEEHEKYSQKLLNKKDSMEIPSGRQSPLENAEPHPIAQKNSTSRPGSSSSIKPGSERRPSISDQPAEAAIVPPAVTQRRRDKSIIDVMSASNQNETKDTSVSNNESLAAVLRPSQSDLMLTRDLPPKPRPPGSSNPNNKKKEKFVVPAAYKHVTSKIDSGRTPVEQLDLQKSIARALKKEMQRQRAQRPRTAGSRSSSASRNQSRERRRRLSSAYEHVQPRINTYRSINFDELDNSQLRTDSSHSIKESVYLEWLKVKEDEKKELKEIKKLEETQLKSIDQSSIKTKLVQQAEQLQALRTKMENDARQKRREERRRQAEIEKAKKQEEEEKIKNAKIGFENWNEKKSEELEEKKREEEEMKKKLIEERHNEKLKRMVKAAAEYKTWVQKKEKKKQEEIEKNKTNRQQKLKTVHLNEEERYKKAQEAYENWLKEKEKNDLDRSLNTSRRNSFSGKMEKPQVIPFLPAGAPKNTGKVQHVAW